MELVTRERGELRGAWRLDRATNCRDSAGERGPRGITPLASPTSIYPTNRDKRHMASRKRRTSPDVKKRRAVRQQEKAAAVRAKYGPSRRPSPVVVRSLATGDVVGVHDQDRFRARSFSDSVEESARAAGFGSYTAYLRSAHWLALRDRALARDRHRCRRCGSRKALQVHHHHYGSLGRESLSTLQTLCSRCHSGLH